MEEEDFKKDLFLRWKLYVVLTLMALSITFLINKCSSNEPQLIYKNEKKTN